MKETMIFDDMLQGKIKGIELLSVDLFDTLITRRFAHPADLFHAMQSKLVHEPEGEKFARFAQARIDCEYRLREAKGFRREITLENIYANIRTELGLSQDRADRARDMELQLESDSIIPVKETADALREIKDTLKLRLVLISDTYLPGTFVSRLLAKNKLAGLFDKLYVSSEHGALKSAGTMFPLVKKAENIPYKKWLHIGDNEESDYKIPMKICIKACLYRSAHLSRYEKNMAPRPGLPRYHSAFAALMRRCRLDCPYKKDNEKMIWDTTINVPAPLIISYVQWCLQKAASPGVNRVYFMARDGQVLFKIASILNRSSSKPVELRYLYVSRQSLLFPAMQEIDGESLDWILAPTVIVTPRIILKRVNIEPEEIEPVLRQHGFNKPDGKLSKKKLGNFRAVLLDSSVKRLLKQRIDQYRENAVGYLRQEGLTQDGDFVLVDIGWNGTLQRSVSRLLAMQEKKYPVKGLYLGLVRELKHKPSDSLDAFFFSPGKPHGLEQETHLVPVFEMFTAADHGGVEKYEYRDDRYEPVLRSKENRAGMRWGVNIQQEAMTYLAGRMMDADIPVSELRREIDRNMHLFIRTPSLREAQVYGSYLDAEDQNESYRFPLARGYNIVELFLHYKFGYVHHHNEWREGARRLSLCLRRPYRGSNFY